MKGASFAHTNPPDAAVQPRRWDRSRDQRGRRRRRVRIARSSFEAVADLVEELAEAFERAGHELEGLAEDAVDLWRGVEEGVTAVGEDLTSLGQEISALPSRWSRSTSTAWTLAQITASYRWHEASRGFRTDEGAALALEELHETNARRFYAAALSQGGAFVKLGQMASARMDLLPAAWVSELSQLQDAVPAAPFEAVRPTIETDLGRSIDELFESFEEEPVAAASIGQVHRAATHDGVVVAVKVQRPGIRDLIEIDMSLFEQSLDHLSSLLPPTDYDTILDEVRTLVLAELDYVNEARMMGRIADFFEGHPKIVVPRPLPGYVGERAFASEFIEGRKITDVLDEWCEERDAGDPTADDRIARVLGLLLECYLCQVLEAGVFQADPHPGNLLVTDSQELVLLDFGCTRPMSDETRGLYLQILQAFIARDREEMARLFTELGFETRSGRAETLHAFADALLRGFDRAVADGEFSWMSEEDAFEQAAALLHTAQEDPVTRLPAEFVMLGRVFGTLGGLFHHYRPKLDATVHVLPVLARAMASHA